MLSVRTHSLSDPLQSGIRFLPHPSSAVSSAFFAVRLPLRGDNGAGTDQRNGVNFDQHDGGAVGGCMRYDMIGASAHVARHAAKSAESNRTRNLAWQSLERTGRPGVR